MVSNKSYAGHCTAPEFNDKIRACRGVILVCGSCEQHGHHLPLDTDNIIGTEIALRIAEKTGLLVMPPVNYGQVWSAKGFPGTISLSPNTLKLLLKEIWMGKHLAFSHYIFKRAFFKGKISCCHDGTCR